MTAPRIRLAHPEVGEAEVEAIRAVLESGIYTGGPRTSEFERAFAELHEAEYAVAFANGTVALAGMLLAHGIGPGDEVVVPSMTFVSTATAVLHVGATPIFADIRPDTFDLDAEDVATRLTAHTKAILVVHYAGQPADLPALAKVAADADVLLLEDAAQAHGARLAGRAAGSWGASAMFSFTPTKNITTGEGGLVTTASVELAERLRLLRNHGSTGTYHHELVGYNWRLTELQAAMGLVQLTRLPQILQRKRANAAAMTARLKELPGVTPPATRAGAEPVHMIYTVLLDDGVDRDSIHDQMRAAGIEAKIYFPPVHQQPIFADSSPRLPVTERVATQMLSLPCHAALTEPELDAIVETLRSAMADTSR